MQRNVNFICYVIVISMLCCDKDFTYFVIFLSLLYDTIIVIV